MRRSLILLAFLMLCLPLLASDADSAAGTIAGRIPLARPGVTAIAARAAGLRNYVLLQYADSVAVIDATRPWAPVTKSASAWPADIAIPDAHADGNIAVVGSAPAQPQTRDVAIVDTSDMEHPAVLQKFRNVLGTARTRDFLYVLTESEVVIVRLRAEPDPVELGRLYGG